MDTEQVKKWLRRYAGLKMEVENQLGRIARAESNAQFPEMRAGDESKHHPGGKGHLERATIRLMEIKAKLLPVIAENKAAMKQIEDAIDSLADPFESEVLRMRYLDDFENEDTGLELRCRLTPWRDIAISLYGDNEEKHIQAAHRLHREALESIGEVIEKSQAEEN